MVALSFERSVQISTYDRVDSLILDCVKRGMGVLGESGTAAILYHIKARFGLGEAQIPHNPQGFVSALRYIFGGQAQLIIHAIMEEMRSNATCDRRFLRFASALETTMPRDLGDEANYLATRNAPATEISTPDTDERDVMLFIERRKESINAIVEEMRSNESCDSSKRRSVRCAGVLETYAGRRYADKANYQATGNDSMPGTPTGDADERSSGVSGEENGRSGIER